MYASSPQKPTAPVGKQATVVAPFQRQSIPSKKEEEPELQEQSNASSLTKQLKSVQQIADQSPQSTGLLQFQRMANRHTTRQGGLGQKNKHGLPHALQSGIEQLSGQSMEDVRVHYNSPKPAQLQAYAYAQGRDIHLSSGQEKHLPHEAWHVVQQKQGRVQPTLQMKGKVNINDDVTLEREADVMGARALTTGLERAAHQGLGQLRATALSASNSAGQPIQRALRKGISKNTYNASRKVAKNIIIKGIGSNKPITEAIIDAINDLHLEDEEDYTIKQAYELVLKKVKADPRIVTGRKGKGTHLVDVDAIMSWAEDRKADTSELETYLDNHSDIVTTALTHMEVRSKDISFSSSQSATQVKSVFTDAMMALPAKLMRTVSSFNALARAEVKSESGIGSAWKGNQFEQWVDLNLFPAFKHRLFFKHKDLAKDRATDGFDKSTNEIWEYKHYHASVPASQFWDYATIISKKIKDTTKKYTPTAVNYLFQNKATAKTNLWIAGTGNFHVWYVKPGMPPKAIKLA